MFLAKCTMGEILPVIRFIKAIFNIIQFLIPVGLIIMGTIDLGKAVLSSDDKEIKQATSKLIKRAIAAVSIFFIVLLVKLVMNTVAKSDDEDSDVGDSSSWIDCWDEA